MNGRYDYDEIKLYVPLLFPSGCDEKIFFFYYLFSQNENILIFVLIRPFYAAEVSL
jgi:hypothetical protein